MDLKKMEQGFRMMLEGMGEDIHREGLLDTPRRVAKMYEELLSGLEDQSSEDDLLKTQFTEAYDEMILLKDIPFVSLCEHHFLPFIGKAHVAYIPGDRIVGLSKLARVVEFYARRPQVQERMTRQIAELIQKQLNPKGVAVVLESSHTCMTIRGIKKQGATMFTSQLFGLFKKSEKTRSEFMSLIHRRDHE
ncbi:MAG: GTP cyclohydrolase I FolE [Fibrobacter sp.]|jgi:GTP cyclohydrolase I|nr:GTP cyclohydrolase I FolE [Fibrobacter sp.]